MTTMDVPGELKLTQLRKQNLRKTFEDLESHSSSILFLALQWKDIEFHFDSIQKSISHRQEQLTSLEESLRKRLEEVKLRENRVGSLQKLVNKRFGEMESREANEKLVFEERAKELDLMRVSVEERSREVEMVQGMVEEGLNALNLKEKRFRMLEKSIDEQSKELEVVQNSIKESFREIELKERRLGLVENSIDERVKEIELREKRIEECSNEIKLEEKQVEELIKEVQWKENRFHEWETAIDLKEKRLGERSAEFELKEVRFEEFAKTFDLKENRLEERAMAIDLKEKRLGQRSAELELKELRFEEFAKAFDLKEKRLEERTMEIELMEERFKERAEKLELKEKFFEESTKENNLKEKILEERSMEIELQEKGLVERSRGIELKENKLEQRAKEVELKEKQFEQCSQGVETKDEGFAEIVNYDVKGEAFETLAVNTAIANFVCNNAQLSGAIDGMSLQMLLNKHCEEHDLMHDEVSAVLRVSSDPGKLVLDAIQGFYPLDAENGNQSVELSVIRKSCIVLLEGLMGVSPVIKPNVKGEAMKLAFDWMSKMRPEGENHTEVLGFLLLLAAYRLASAFDWDELMTHLLVVAQDRQAPELCWTLGLVDKISDFIRNLIKEKKDLDAIRLVYAFKLVGKFQPVKILKTYLRKSKKASRINCRIRDNSRAAQITAFNKRIADVKAVIRCIEEHNLESEYSTRNLQNFIAELNKQKAALIRPSRTPGPTPNIQQQQPRRSKRLRTAVSPGANSSNHSKQSLHQQPSGFNTGQVSSGISTQAEIKQTKLENFQNNYPESWNLSFEQLMIVSPQMKACRKEAAMRLAANMKMKLDAKIENPVELDVFHFLQLVATYELGSSFDADELLGLFEYVYRRKQAPKLYLALGLVDKIPKFIENLVAAQQWREAIRYVSAFELNGKLPLVPILKGYLSHSKKIAEERWEKNNSPGSLLWAIKIEFKASKTALKFIADQSLESEYPPEILENRIAQLKKEKQDILNVMNSRDGFAPVTRFNSKLVQRNSEKKHTLSTTAIAATNALTPAPAPATEAQSKQLSGNKHPRTLESAETAQYDFVGAVTNTSEQTPPHPNGSFHNSHGLQNFTGHYSFGGFPPVNKRIGYPNVPVPISSYYPRDALDPGHFDRAVTYGGPCEALNPPIYYDHPRSFGGHGNVYRGPDYHNGQAPPGGHGLPPHHHPSFNQ